MKDPRAISLGQRLRTERINKHDTQADFAARIGASVPTLRKMEEGDSGVQMKYWLAALDILGRSDDMDHLIAAGESLFDRANATAAPPGRQRVTRKRHTA